MFDRSSRPSSVSPNHFSFAPVRCESSCHGTMLEWCSISVMTISASASTRYGSSAQPSMLATRLSDSEAFLVKITSSRLGALTKAATLSRAPSYSAVASSASTCTPRWTLALCRS